MFSLDNESPPTGFASPFFSLSSLIRMSGNADQTHETDGRSGLPFSDCSQITGLLLSFPWMVKKEFPYPLLLLKLMILTKNMNK